MAVPHRTNTYPKSSDRAHTWVAYLADQGLLRYLSGACLGKASACACVARAN